MLLKDLFVHICILVTFIFLGGVIFKNSEASSLKKNQILFGVFFGILGSILMFFSIQVDVETIIDLRHIPIIVAAMFGGITVSFICSLIIAISRILFVDITPIMLIVSLTTILVGILVGLIGKLKIQDTLKWLFMIVSSTAVFSIILYFRVREIDHFGVILLNYWLLSIFGSTLTLILVNYISRANYLHNEYKRYASIDYLTGLKNVREFNLTLAKLLVKASSDKSRFALLFIDIDHFKQINDQYGHQAGDAILQQFGQLLLDTIPNKDLAFRNGGEEFSAILLNVSGEEAKQMAEIIRERVEKYRFRLPDKSDFEISLSIGVSMNKEKGEQLDEIIKRADQALYQAKSEGRNKVVCFIEQ